MNGGRGVWCAGCGRTDAIKETAAWVIEAANVEK